MTCKFIIHLQKLEKSSLNKTKISNYYYQMIVAPRIFSSQRRVTEG